MQEDHIVVLNINGKPIHLGDQMAYYVYIKDEEGLKMWRNMPGSEWYPDLDVGIWVHEDSHGYDRAENIYVPISEKINWELRMLQHYTDIQTFLTSYKQNSVE